MTPAGAQGITPELVDSASCSPRNNPGDHRSSPNPRRERMGTRVRLLLRVARGLRKRGFGRRHPQESRPIEPRKSPRGRLKTGVNHGIPGRCVQLLSMDFRRRGAMLGGRGRRRILGRARPDWELPGPRPTFSRRRFRCSSLGRDSREGLVEQAARLRLARKGL